MAYTKPELSLVLPYGHTTLEMMIKKGDFPDGISPYPGGHKIWPRAFIDKWIKENEQAALMAESRAAK